MATRTAVTGKQPHPTGPILTPADRVTTRAWYLDNLRILLVILVVAHHAAQAYGPTGGSWPVGQAERADLLGPFITLNSMFFMGLFFFISGYFTPGAFDRKGLRSFVVDKLWRLGLPALAWLPLHRLTDGKWEWEFAHLWFVLDLLALNLLYAGWRAWRGTKTGEASAPPAPAVPGDLAIVGFILFLGAVTGVVRIWFPVDRWIRFAGVLPMEPAHWPQYLALFVLGFWAWRTRWLDRLTSAQGRRWCGIALVMVAFVCIAHVWPPAQRGQWFRTGGLRWQNWHYAVLESLLCVSLSIGLLWFFREYLRRAARWAQQLAADSYGIYWAHVIPVVGVQLALREAPLGPLAKFAVATVGGFGLSWITCHFALRRGWLGRKIF